VFMDENKAGLPGVLCAGAPWSLEMPDLDVAVIWVMSPQPAALKIHVPGISTGGGPLPGRHRSEGIWEDPPVCSAHRQPLLFLLPVSLVGDKQAYQR
jgi:hypothetical protein